MSMKKIVTFCWCVFESSIALVAFSLNEARRVYDESPLTSQSACSEVGEYIFMELKWNVASDSSDENNEKQEMFAIMDALQNYIVPKQIAVTNSPFCNILTDWLIPTSEFNIPKVTSTTLKEEETNGVHRMVMAFDAKELHIARDDAKKMSVDLNKYSTTQWKEALLAAYTNFKTRDEKRKFFFLLGCPIVAFLDKKIGLDENILSGRTDKGSLELSKLLNWKPEQGSIYFEYPVLNWSFYKQSKSDIFYPTWSETDGGAFVEAEKLYLQGKDVPKIISLLVESITKNPIGSLKWEYLGGVMKVSNRHQDAVIAYMQSLRQNSDSVYAWKGLMESAKKSGMVSNGDGLKWYLRMKGIIQ